MDIAKQVQSAYDQIVEAYADRNHNNMPKNLIALGHTLIQHIGRQARILDVGCGTGRDMAWFELKDIAVTGIDLSFGMLAYAQKSVKGSLVMMDMRHLSFNSASFEGIWCCASLLHLPKSDAPLALKEIRCIIKPGGMLILSIQSGDSEGWEEGYVKNVKRFFARYTIEEMTSMLTECGFSILETAETQEGIRNWISFICMTN